MTHLLMRGMVLPSTVGRVDHQQAALDVGDHELVPTAMVLAGSSGMASHSSPRARTGRGVLALNGPRDQRGIPDILGLRSARVH